MNQLLDRFAYLIPSGQVCSKSATSQARTTASVEAVASLILLSSAPPSLAARHNSLVEHH